MTPQPHRELSPSLRAFELFLRNEGMRLTRERRVVAEAIFADEGHFDAEDLHLRLNRDSGRVSRATLYRTLDLLVRGGLVRKSRMGRDSFLYEHVYGRNHHEHLSCISCGRILEFTSDEIETLQEEVCRRLGFHAVRHTLHISGYCADCGKP